MWFNQIGIQTSSNATFSVTGLAAGSHILNISFSGSSDQNDNTDVVLIEYPF
jgi:hypothetical protein